jgi:hypothetical protein
MDGIALTAVTVLLIFLPAEAHHVEALNYYEMSPEASYRHVSTIDLNERFVDGTQSLRRAHM